MEAVNAEREKLKKKAGKKAPELDAKWGPIKEEYYTYLPEDVLVACIQDRLAHPDCNAGAIFDNLASP